MSVFDSKIEQEKIKAAYKQIKDRLLRYHLSKNDTKDTIEGAIIGWKARDCYHNEIMELVNEANEAFEQLQIGLEWRKEFNKVVVEKYHWYK